MKLRLFYLLLVVLCSFSCGSNNIKETKVGILMMARDDSKFLKKMRSDFGDMVVHYNIDIIFKNSYGDSNLQMQQLDDLLEQKIKVLIVSTLFRDDCAKIIKKAKKAKVPVVFLNNEPYEKDMSMWNKVYYVGPKSKMGGEIAAEIIADYFNSHKKADLNNDGIIQYVVLAGSQDNKSSSVRNESFDRYFKNNENWKAHQIDIRYCNWIGDKAYSAMDELVEEYGDDIEAIFSHGDEMALAALSFLGENSYADKFMPIVGMDGLPEAINAIANGKIIGSAFYDDKKLVKILGEMIISLSTGKGVKATTLDFTSEDGKKSGNYGYIPYHKVVQDNFGKF